MIVDATGAVGMLNHLRLEVVCNAAKAISSRDDVTLAELHGLIDVIEHEASLVARMSEERE